MANWNSSAFDAFLSAIDRVDKCCTGIVFWLHTGQGHTSIMNKIWLIYYWIILSFIATIITVYAHIFHI